MKLIAFRDYSNGYRGSRRAEGRNAGRDIGVPRCEPQILSLANTLSWLVPDAQCCVSTNSPGTGLTSKLVRFCRSVLEHRADLLNDRAVRSGTSCTGTTSSRNSSGSVRRDFG